VTFACPLCQAPLLQPSFGEYYYCQTCKKEYPSCAGVPDFRVFPDPFFSVEEDQRRSELILGELDRRDFSQLLEYYWSLSEITPPLLRRKFVRSALLGEDRAQRILSSFEDGTFRTPVKARRVLDVGSGSGNFLIVAAQHFSQVIGIDIGMRHLQMGRRRFIDRGVPVPALACCCAECLPFPDGYFDLIVMSSTLEFVRDQEKVLAECVRTLAPGGALYIQTVNRYSIARDPYAYLWGVGFLPRTWQAGYVRWRRQAIYSHIKTISLRELKRLTADQFRHREIALPDVQASVLSQFEFTTRLQIRVYKALRSSPILRDLLSAVGPGWEVLLRKA
jgi:ubiquinone/menaquinone biosynthesis C-methylase UbiE